MDSQIQIFDNFLNETDFNKLEKLLLAPDNFPYYFTNYKVIVGDNFPQFTHKFYNDNNINSNFYNELNCILEKINPISLIKIKANLQIKDTMVRKTKMHQDFQNPLDNQKTGIFYMNTNNGKTIFEDGEEIDSLANRMVIFPASKLHAGTTHTDVNYRCVINFNWF